MEKGLIALIIILIILIVLAVLVFFMFAYNPFTIDENQNISSCKFCRCIGILKTIESYPPQYECTGLELCKDIDISKCE